MVELESTFEYSGRLVVAPIVTLDRMTISNEINKKGVHSIDPKFKTLESAEGLAIEYVYDAENKSRIVVAFIRPKNILEVVNQERLADVINDGLEAEFLRLAAFAMTVVTCEQEFSKANKAQDSIK